MLDEGGILDACVSRVGPRLAASLGMCQPRCCRTFCLLELEAWQCSICWTVNQIGWLSCSGCSAEKPREKLARRAFFSGERSSTRHARQAQAEQHLFNSKRERAIVELARYLVQRGSMSLLPLTTAASSIFQCISLQREASSSIGGGSRCESPPAKPKSSPSTSWVYSTPPSKLRRSRSSAHIGESAGLRTRSKRRGSDGDSLSPRPPRSGGDGQPRSAHSSPCPTTEQIRSHPLNALRRSPSSPPALQGQWTDDREATLLSPQPCRLSPSLAAAAHQPGDQVASPSPMPAMPPMPSIPSPQALGAVPKWRQARAKPPAKTAAPTPQAQAALEQPKDKAVAVPPARLPIAKTAPLPAEGAAAPKPPAKAAAPKPRAKEAARKPAAAQKPPAEAAAPPKSPAKAAEPRKPPAEAAAPAPATVGAAAPASEPDSEPAAGKVDGNSSASGTPRKGPKKRRSPKKVRARLVKLARANAQAKLAEEAEQCEQSCASAPAHFADAPASFKQSRNAASADKNAQAARSHRDQRAGRKGNAKKEPEQQPSGIRRFLSASRAASPCAEGAGPAESTAAASQTTPAKAQLPSDSQEGLSTSKAPKPRTLAPCRTDAGDSACAQRAVADAAEGERSADGNARKRKRKAQTAQAGDSQQQEQQQQSQPQAHVPADPKRHKGRQEEWEGAAEPASAAGAAEAASAAGEPSAEPLPTPLLKASTSPGSAASAARRRMQQARTV